MKNYHVYILTNKTNGTLYIGVTGDLQRRMIEHKLEAIDGFTKNYGLKRLVYTESYKYVNDALRREKMLKAWKRAWKIDLIEKQNPEWLDLYELFYGGWIPAPRLG